MSTLLVDRECDSGILDVIDWVRFRPPASPLLSRVSGPDSALVLRLRLNQEAAWRVWGN